MPVHNVTPYWQPRGGGGAGGNASFGSGPVYSYGVRKRQQQMPTDHPEGVGYAEGGGVRFDEFWDKYGKQFFPDGKLQLPSFQQDQPPDWSKLQRLTGSVQRPKGYASGGFVDSDPMNFIPDPMLQQSQQRPRDTYDPYDMTKRRNPVVSPYMLAQEPGYAQGGAVIPSYSGYVPIKSDPVARRRYNQKHVGYAEGGDIDMPEEPQAGPDLAGYIHGTNAIDPNELEQVLQQIAQLDPNMDEDAVNLTAIVQAAQSGDMEQASSILAGFRKRFDSLNAHAQGAAAHGDLAAAAQLAGKAHSQVPDGMKVAYAVGEDGSVTATVTPSGQTFTMSGQQFHDYLVGPGTSFDHLLENGLEKNLQIASGAGAAAQTPTGYAAGGDEAPASGVDDPLGLLSADEGAAPTGSMPDTPPPPPEQPPGYAEGGEVESDEEERRRQQQQEATPRQQKTEDISDVVRNVVDYARKKFGLGSSETDPQASPQPLVEPAGGRTALSRGVGHAPAAADAPEQAAPEQAAPASSRRVATRPVPAAPEEPRLGAKPLPGPASASRGVEYPEKLPAEDAIRDIIIPPERVPGAPPASARTGTGRRSEPEAPQPQQLGSREDISLPPAASLTDGQVAPAAPVSPKQAAYNAAHKAAADRGDIYTTPAWSLERAREGISDISQGKLFGRKNIVDYSEVDRQFPDAQPAATVARPLGPVTPEENAQRKAERLFQREPTYTNTDSDRQRRGEPAPGESGQQLREPAPPKFISPEPPIRVQTKQGVREFANPRNAGIEAENRRLQHQYDIDLRRYQQSDRQTQQVDSSRLNNAVEIYKQHAKDGSLDQMPEGVWDILERAGYGKRPALPAPAPAKPGLMETIFGGSIKQPTTMGGWGSPGFPPRAPSPGKRWGQDANGRFVEY